jgi:hypothetical protein
MSIFDRPRPTGPPRDAGPLAASGRDALPLDEVTRADVRRRIERGERRVRAIEDAQTRQAQEALDGPYYGAPFGAERLLRELRSVREASRDPRVMARRLVEGADDRDELRARGWRDDWIDAAQEDLRRSLARRVAEPEERRTASPLTAGGVGHLVTSSAPPAVAHLTRQDRAAALRNVAALRAAGIDVDRDQPGWRERLASAVPDRPVQPDQWPPARREAPGRGVPGPTRSQGSASRSRATKRTP